MLRFKKVHMMVTLVALMAALSALMALPVSAGGTTCPSNVAVGATVNDNLSIGATDCTNRGTVNGNMEASGAGFVRVRGGVLNGNAIQEGTGSIIVDTVGDRDATVEGNLEQKGGSVGPEPSLDVRAFMENTTHITGNAINEGPGFTEIKATSGGTIWIDGNVEAKGGGGGSITQTSGSTVIVDGNTCGVVVGAGVVVNGEVKTSC